MRRREMVLSSLAILGSFIGGSGLILLTIFDTKRHRSLHRLFLLVFMLGVALSAGFTCLEVCLKAVSHKFLGSRFASIVPLDKQRLRRG
jgi:uncharacterized membrane protein YbjE (DUF340 family)